MNKLAARLAAAAIKDVHIEGVGWFRIHRITSADIMTAGGGFLLAARRDVLAAQADAPEGVEETQAQQIERVGAAMLADPEKIAASARYQGTIVCAGVQQTSEDGKAWEPIQIVEKGASEPGANRLNVADIPQDVVIALCAEILTLSMGGAAREGINSFPRGGAALAPATGA